MVVDVMPTLVARWNYLVFPHGKVCGVDAPQHLLVSNRDGVGFGDGLNDGS